MYRDFLRLHVGAAILFVGTLGLAGDAARQGHGGKAALWVLASAACLTFLIAPLFLKRAAKRRAGPPGRHGRTGRGSVKY
jgi:hypothetical protein